MAFDKLTKPNKGLSFWVFNILFHLNFAKTLVWSKQNEDGSERTTYFIAMTMIEHEFPEGIRRAINVIIGPFKVTIGIAL